MQDYKAKLIEENNRLMNELEAEAAAWQELSEKVVDRSVEGC